MIKKFKKKEKKVRKYGLLKATNPVKQSASANWRTEAEQKISCRLQ